MQKEIEKEIKGLAHEYVMSLRYEEIGDSILSERIFNLFLKQEYEKARELIIARTLKEGLNDAKLGKALSAKRTIDLYDRLKSLLYYVECHTV